MNRVALVCAPLALLVLTGCQTNHLNDYMGKIERVGVFIPEGEPLAWVDLGQNQNMKKDQKLWGSVANADAKLTSARMIKRLQKIEKTGVLDDALLAGFLHGARGLQGIEIVPEAEDADTFIDLKVDKFGFQSMDPKKRPKMYFTADAAMQYGPEGDKLIWDKGFFIDEKLTAEGIKKNFPKGTLVKAEVKGSVNGSFKIDLPDPSLMEHTAENLSAVENLSDDDLTKLFAAFAMKAGESMGEDLANGR
jgi:hypothetical protein